MADRTKQVNSSIENLLSKAEDLALKEVERIAREFLKDKPGYEFLMCMGTYYFGFPTNINPPLLKCKELDEFMSEWDSRLGLSGNAMRFTYDSEVVTDW